MNFTRLYLIRHGQVVGYEQPRYNGHTDVDLTDLGRSQLEAVATDLEGTELAAVYSSDLIRARFGGEALVRSRDLELRIEPSFRELYFGDWEGLSFAEVNERYPGAMERRRKDIVQNTPPGGENVTELWDRVQGKWREVLAEHRGSSLALVAHSGVNRAMILQALGSTPENIWRVDQGYGCLNIIDYYEDGFVLVKLANSPNRYYGM